MMLPWSVTLAVLASSAAALALPLVPWLGRRLLDVDHRTESGLLIISAAAGAAAVAVALRAHRSAHGTSSARTMGVSAMAGALLCVLGTELHASTLVALGALGMAMATAAFVLERAFGVPARGLFYPALGAAVALPYRADLDAWIGWPARTLSTRVASELLSAVGVKHASGEALLLLEGGMADVDIPCSGLSSLWTMVAVVLLVCMWPRTPNRLVPWHRCCASLLLGALLVLWGNAIRVAILAYVELQLRWPEVARVLHEPLGVCVFLGAIAIALALLRPMDAPPSPPASPWMWQGAALACASAAVFAWSTPTRSENIATATAPFELALDGVRGVTRMALHPSEAAFFRNDDVALARKWRIDDRSLQGSVLVVVATSWRAHHPPERCLAAQGLALGPAFDSVAGGGAPHHALRLTDAQNRELRSVSFFVSARRTVPTLASRVWNALWGEEKTWAFVSLLVDARAVPADLDGLVARVHQEVQSALIAGAAHASSTQLQGEP